MVLDPGMAHSLGPEQCTTQIRCLWEGFEPSSSSFGPEPSPSSVTLCGGSALVLCLSVGPAGRPAAMLWLQHSGASLTPSTSAGFTSAPETGTAPRFTTAKHSNSGAGTRASTNSSEQNQTGSSGLPGLCSEEKGKASREWQSGRGRAGLGALKSQRVSREGLGQCCWGPTSPLLPAPCRP